MTSKILPKPVPRGDAAALDALIAGAPGGKPAAAPVAALPAAGVRKKPISLTIDANILAQLDRKAGALGLSRAAAFALAVSRFIAAEEREANR